MMYYSPESYFPYHIVGSILMAVFWVCIVVLIIRLFRRGFGHGRFGHLHGGCCGGMYGHGGDKAMETLRERYVKGEVSKEQFESMKKDLMS